MKKDFLKEVAKYHKEWVDTCKALGGGDYSEDIVQEMYIKLHKYATYDKIIKDGILQKGYVFFTLKSIIYTLKNKQKNVYKEELKNNIAYDDSDIEEHKAFDKFCNSLDDYLLSKEKESEWYRSRLFYIYKETGLSMRKLGELSDISWVSIFYNLKKVKSEIKEEFQEDWDDYINGDYDKL